MDGYNLKTLNIHSLRSCIAVVGQEPVLFSTTIAENIRYGNQSATEQEIVEAAKNSGAHDFISELPDGYDTLIGSSQLSGGQKQRIAIARALVQNPKILLLDEATSALDYQSEKFIQETLDRVSKNRTTIVVSHRLSAIKGADRLLFIEKGNVVEEGTHDELFELKGRYYNMVKSEYSKSKEQPARKRKSFTNSHKQRIDSNHDESSESSEDESSEQSDEYVSQYSSSRKSDESSECNEKSKENISYTQNFIRILRLAKSDWKSLATAVCSAFIIGMAFPLFSVVFAEVYGVSTCSIRNYV